MGCSPKSCCLRPEESGHEACARCHLTSHPSDLDTCPARTSIPQRARVLQNFFGRPQLRQPIVVLFAVYGPVFILVGGQAIPGIYSMRSVIGQEFPVGIKFDLIQCEHVRRRRDTGVFHDLNLGDPARLFGGCYPGDLRRLAASDRGDVLRSDLHRFTSRHRSLINGPGISTFCHRPHPPQAVSTTTLRVH